MSHVDTGADGPVDTGADGPVDTGADGPVDEGADGPVDTGADGPVDDGADRHAAAGADDEGAGRHSAAGPVDAFGPKEPSPALVSVPDGVLVQHVADETVLLHLDCGLYYTLDEVGTRMLDMACALPNADAVVDALIVEYDTTRETLLFDLEVLLGELETQALVVRRG